MEKFYCYIIYSQSLNKYYIGHTSNLENRLNQYNSGISFYTSKGKDWVFVYSKIYETRDQARDEEYRIKKKKSRKYIEWLIKGNK